MAAIHFFKNLIYRFDGHAHMNWVISTRDFDIFYFSIYVALFLHFDQRNGHIKIKSFSCGFSINSQLELSIFLEDLKFC